MSSINPPSTPPRRTNLPPLSAATSPGPSPSYSPGGSAFLRPDHSTVVLPSTSPLISPPPSPGQPSRSTSPFPEFTDKYGSYGDAVTQDFRPNRKQSVAESLLLSTAPTPRHRKVKNRSTASDAFAQTSPVVKAILIILGLIAFTLFLGAVGPSIFTPTKKVMAARLRPLVPISVLKALKAAPSSPIAIHPILPLLISSNKKWNSKLASQSTTYSRAVQTYQMRYSRNPPPGFEKWFAFATQARKHALVDEYDSLMQDLAPFRSLTPQELRRRTVELASVPGISIVSIRNGVAQVHSKSGKWAPALAFQQMLNAFVGDLPDMDIAINEKPEGRVLPRKQKELVMADFEGIGQFSFDDSADPMLKPSLKNFTAEWKKDGSVWDAYRRSCPPEAASRRHFESLRSAETSHHIPGKVVTKTDPNQSRRRASLSAIPAGRELSFAADFDANMELCSMPSMHSLHSAFFSDQRSIEYLFPVFSASKPSGYGDILIPSHHYWQPSSEFTYEWELKRGRSSVTSDLEWEQKNATAYWRGKVTRGADTPPGHGATFQKQRLVKLANQAQTGDDAVLVRFNQSTAALSSIRAPYKELNKVMTDVAMACDPNLGECSHLRSLGYRVEPPAPLSQAWKNKYVLDLDEIGFSPRFLALMESKSAVIKNSIQREFWRGWIQPWYHYIPLSSSYSELYNIQSFFTGIPEPLFQMNSTNGTLVDRPITSLTKPSPVPTLPPLSDGKPFNGDGALKDIALQGSQWRNTHVRKEDMECYVYRLMVEWAAMLSHQPQVDPNNPIDIAGSALENSTSGST